MGIENNEAVLATTWCNDCIEKVKVFINKLPDHHKKLFTIMGPFTNCMSTVVLSPCGSKKYWPQNNQITVLREKFVDFLAHDEEHIDHFSWVEVSYGEYGQSILRGNNENCY